MTRRVAVIGAGIMGGATALFLARRGVEVVLFEAAPAPFAGASRWNEGKIHLGFLYAADPSLRTAQRILPGGLAFKPLLEELIGYRLERLTEMDDTYLVHRRSVVSPDDTRRYFEAVAALIRSQSAASQYLVDVSDARVRPLSAAELAEVAEPQSIVAGFVVPERSVSTRWVADRFVDALVAEPRIELRTATKVHRVTGHEDALPASIQVVTDDGADGGFDAVVNAAWEGGPKIDAAVGLTPDHHWSHRYRVSLFVATDRPVDVPSAVIGTGPFGDVKNFGNREFYVSWYRTGLLASGEAIDPPSVPRLGRAQRQKTANDVFGKLGALVPAVREIEKRAKEVRVEGGWVYASGRGELDDPASTLHRRDHIGITHTGSYVSVDAGKYSIAPWLARQVADAITG